eukprot:jgi/Chlat1/7150/Chrsp57S06821
MAVVEEGGGGESIYRLVTEGPFDPSAGRRRTLPAPAATASTGRRLSGPSSVVGSTVAAATAHKGMPMHLDSSQVLNALNPVRGPRDALKRRGIAPHNHMKDNRLAVQEKSAINQLRKLDAQLESRQQEKPTAQTSRRSSFNGAPAPAAPKQQQPAGRDFVRENAEAATLRTARPLQPATDGNPYLQKEDYGRVPKYLQARKIQWAVDAAQRQEQSEREQCPPGMVLLSEEERLETLRTLEYNRGEVEASIMALPFVIETPSQIRLKNSLERKMSELDEAIKLFSRKKVFVGA